MLTSLLIFPFEVYFGIILITQLLAESEVSLANDFIAAEHMMSFKHFSDVQLVGTLEMVLFA